MTDEEIMEEIDVATGYGLAALSLQAALAVRLALSGGLSPRQMIQIADTAKQVAASGVLETSAGAVTIAQAAIDGLSRTWRKQDKRN